MQALRIELEAALASGKSSTAPVELDQTRVGRLSRVDAMQGQAMAKASAARAAQQLAATNAAIKRLAHADFGLCVDCDEPIAWARLQYNPSVRCCIACAEQNEAR